MVMKKSALEPHILCKKGDIAPYVLLPGDPGRVLRMAKQLDFFKEISFNREYRVVTGKYQDLPITICSTGIGGPSTAIALEELINLGAHTFIRVGSCGACQKNIKIGDVIIPDSVIREDHTCLDYVPLQFPAVADRHLLRALENTAVKIGAKYHIGASISSDALYSNANKERKVIWSKFGALAQDMEAGTVLTLARVKGVRGAAILLVVDAEGEKNIKAKIATYSSEAQKGKGRLVEMEKRAISIALEALLTSSKK